MKTDTAELNGNQFVKEPHLFVTGQGTYFPTLERAIAQGTTPNGVGFWTKEIEFNGETFYQAGNTNVWN